MWYDNPQGIPGIIDSVSENDNQRVYQLATLIRAYSPALVPNYLRSRFVLPISFNTESPKLNVINQICRHATNYFGRSFPKPVFLPMGGTSEKAGAEVSTQFVNGLWYEKDLYSTLRNALLIATITGTGIVKTIETDKDICFESILPTEVFVFDEESEVNNIRSLFQTKFVDKGQLAARFPQYSAQIMGYSNQINQAQIRVTEAWHLPSDEDATDGRHVMVADPDIVLLDEEYSQNDFPFSFFKYIEPPIGFWGEGLGHILLPYQIKINQLLRNIEQNIKLLGNVKVYVDANSGISMDHLSNDLRGVIVPYSGKRPEIPIQPVVSPDILQHLQFLLQESWRAARFNQETQSGQIPPGVTSKVALLTVADMAAESHILTGKQWEGFVLDIAKKTMDAAQRIQERTGKIETVFITNKKVERVSLKDALTDEKKYKLEIQSSSRTRDTVSGRLELAQYLGEIGVWGKEQIVESLDVPGVWDDVDTELSETRNIDRILKNLTKGIKTSPHPKLNLQLAKTKGLKYYNKLEYEEADEDQLYLVSQWVDEVDKLIQDAETQEKDKMMALQQEAQAVAQGPATEPAQGLPPEAYGTDGTGLPDDLKAVQ